MIYLDNAATTKLGGPAKEAMLDCMTKTWGNPSSLHTPGQRANEVLQQSRQTIARLLGADEKEIYFTSGGSESDNQAILSAARFGARKGKKHLVSTTIEHHAVLHTLKRLEQEGFEVTLVPVGPSGVVAVADVAAALRADTALLTVMYANNEIGTLQPISELGALCRDRGILFHTDAVQAAGHIRLDVNALKVDLLSISAHKFHGPLGAGVLYARKGIPLTNIIEGGAQERGKRAGTENLPAIAGMAAALEQACKTMEQTNEQLLALRGQLIQGLSEIPYAVLNGEAIRRLPGNVNFCFEGIEGEGLLLLLDAKGICASSGSACTSGSLDPSHVLLAIGRPHEIAHGSLRLTLSEETTAEEIAQTIEAVKEVVAYLRGISPVWNGLMKGDLQHVI